MVHHVYLPAHRSVQAIFWLIENIIDYDTYKPTWAVNNCWIHPDTLYDIDDKYKFAIACDLINLNNREGRKTHSVDFQFLKQEDAIWFKIANGSE